MDSWFGSLLGEGGDTPDHPHQSGYKSKRVQKVGTAESLAQQGFQDFVPTVPSVPTGKQSPRKSADSTPTPGNSFSTVGDIAAGIVTAVATGQPTPAPALPADLLERVNLICRLTEVNEKLKHIKNITEQNVAGMKVYGRGWGEIKGILKLNQDAMAEAEETAQRLHLIVGPDGVEQTKNYKASMRDLKLVSESLNIQLGNALLPTMVKVGSFMGEEGPVMGAAFAKILESISFAARALWLALKDMGVRCQHWPVCCRGVCLYRG